LRYQGSKILAAAALLTGCGPGGGDLIDMPGETGSVDAGPSAPDADLPMPDASSPATGSVEITGDWETLLSLEKPTGKFDEPSFGGFNYLISSLDTGLNASDVYINIGDETTAASAIAVDLGKVGDLSGVAFDFSIRHESGDNYSFRVTNASSGESTTLCWGVSCPSGSIATELLDGQVPISNYNGLQVQLRSQDVQGSSAKLENLELIGMTPTAGSAPLLATTVKPDTPSTIPIDPPGRVGQWILGTDLAVMDWELKGRITLSRPDDATSERSKVRLAVDFVHDTRL